MKDPVVEEVLRIRERISVRFNHDARKYAAHICARRKSDGHKVVDLSKKRKTG